MYAVFEMNFQQKYNFSSIEENYTLDKYMNGCQYTYKYKDR